MNGIGPVNEHERDLCRGDHVVPVPFCVGLSQLLIQWDEDLYGKGAVSSHSTYR